MTLNEAIEDLETRKKMVQAHCVGCWDEAVEMALQILKDKRDGELIPVPWIERYQLGKGYSPGGMIDRMVKAWRKENGVQT
ncbi:MAG: hypothetical protein IJ091_03625 [Oscillospiraceae bacterium]|nr:hypothetical protein [Oscillospiraceae bacterium]